MRNQLNLMIVKKFKPDYKKANKAAKSQILNQLQELTKMDRKHLIKLMANNSSLELIKPPGRPQVYDKEVYEHIKHLHSLMERISPKRMKVAIPLWLPFYEKHYGELNKQIRKQLLKVSSSTIGRILKSFKDQQRGKSSTRVNYKLKNLIPLKRLES